MKIHRIYLILCIVVRCLFFQLQANAQYRIDKSVFGNGGTEVISNNYQLNNTLGQPLIGVAGDATYNSRSGFWYSGAVPPADTVTWKTNLIVADAGNSSGTLTFGQAPTATAGLDTTLGEVDLPPSPPTGIFDARFELPVSNPTYSIKDYRNIDQENATWIFQFQPSTAGYPIKISWDRSELPPGNFVIKDEVTGDLVKADMRSVDNVIVTNSAIKSLMIEMTKVTWKASLVVADAGNDNVTLTFGQAPEANDGQDLYLGETELPPPPPPGIFDARFELPGVTIETLKDFRNDADKSIIWNFKFQPGSGGFPITLGWNSMELPDKSFYLKDEITGTLIFVNMKDQNSYTVTNSAITSLVIEMTSEITGDVTVFAGWNLLSVPVLAADMSVNTLFSNAASYAFRFDNGYLVEDTLVNGEGYWLKFNQADTFHISGQPVAEKRVAVNAGWNIIGPFESKVLTSNITSEPVGIVQSEYFEFENGYKIAAELQVGKGYWVKVSQAGALILTSGNSLNKPDMPIIAGADQDMLNKLPRLLFKDSNGHSGILYLALNDDFDNGYELPPVPPAGIFDVRYSSGRYLESLNKTDLDIQLSSVHFPVKISAENLNGYLLHLKDKVGGKVLNQNLEQGEEIQISQPLTRMSLAAQLSSSIVPLSYELKQNYPNPFNPSTTINFSLPVSGHVRISVFDVLGRKVTDLVDAEMPAGYHQVEFNNRNCPSGTYFYVMESGNFKAVKKLSILK